MVVGIVLDVVLGVVVCVVVGIVLGVVLTYKNCKRVQVRIILSVYIFREVNRAGLQQVD